MPGSKLVLPETLNSGNSKILPYRSQKIIKSVHGTNIGGRAGKGGSIFPAEG
jgi:hypothetical protein